VRGGPGRGGRAPTLATGGKPPKPQTVIRGRGLTPFEQLLSRVLFPSFLFWGHTFRRNKILRQRGDQHRNRRSAFPGWRETGKSGRVQDRFRGRMSVKEDGPCQSAAGPFATNFLVGDHFRFPISRKARKINIMLSKCVSNFHGHPIQGNQACSRKSHAARFSHKKKWTRNFPSTATPALGHFTNRPHGADFRFPVPDVDHSEKIQKTVFHACWSSARARTSTCRQIFARRPQNFELPRTTAAQKSFLRGAG